MQWIVELMSTIGIFIGALFILVLIHELGHFLAAKFFGMRVERFSIGFPPKIFGVQKGETEYVIGATPLGGYVKISGMIDESMDTEHLEKEPEDWEFRSKPVWQRIVVISAGVIFNMILAILIFAGIVLSSGEQRIPNESVSGIYVRDSSLVHDVGFRTDDKLVAVNGERAEYFGDLFSSTQLTKPELSYTLIRDGREMTLTMPDSLLDEINDRGFISFENIIPAKLSSIQEGSPAGEAGLEAGDQIIAVNGESVKYWFQLVDLIKSTDSAMNLTVERGSQTFQAQVTPNEDNIIGILVEQNLEALFDAERIQYGVLGSLTHGYDQTVETTTGIIQGFQKMFSGDISIRENLGGPVAIANITKEQTDRSGWIGFWNITAFLSVTLAIMNILPIPALDGGHLVFLAYEGITRREPSEKVRMAMQQVGFVVLMLLILLVTFNDILRLF